MPEGAAKAQTEDAEKLKGLKQVEPGEEDDDIDNNLPLPEKCKALWDKDAKLQSEFSSFEAYLAFEKAVESKSAKILKK